VTAIVGVHGVGNYPPGQPAAKVAARRSADWAASVATGLGMRPDALDMTVAYYAPFLHAGEPAAQVATLDPDRALDTLDPDTDALARSWIEALDLPEVTVQGRLAVPLRHAVTAAADRFSLNGKLTKQDTHRIDINLVPPDLKSRPELRDGDLGSVFADAINTIRTAVASAATGDDPFTLTASIVNISFAVTAEGGISLGADGGLTNELTHTLTLGLVPA